MLHELTIHEAARLLRTGEITATELTEAVLDRILAVDNAVKAYLTLTPELALEQAAEADRAIAAARRADRLADLPLLAGIPLAIKDVITVEGVRTTCGSKILEDYLPPYQATAVDRLVAAGAVILGKTNTDEFAMGSSPENSAYFATRNPWDLQRVPGGSSGGSAAAVAAGECLAALGSDTGGSVRQPAALCGIVGLKPTYGRVSRYGLVAYASSLDQIGPLTKDVTDAAILLGAIAGHDPQDSTSMDVPVPDYVATVGGQRSAVEGQETAGAQDGLMLRGLRVGVPQEDFVPGMQSEVESAVRAAIGVLAELGAEVREISLPHTDLALPVYYLIAPAEASANLARYDGIRYGFSAPGATLWETYRKTRGQGFGPEVKRRIMLGTYALSAGYYDAYYLKAQQVRTLIKADFDAALREVDVIACPTTPTTAFRLGEKIDDPLSMYLSDVFTLSLNLAGLPGMSVPCGFDAAGLPIGLQLIAGAFQEPLLLRVAYAYEQAAGWHKRKPQLIAEG
ncbi:MAG: Asp-tRNA(Asn)/Glu-tRNA(Gln) amidotransferase subunit GatA [Anaerolineae bacterium]|nr:Asp-tRNA(Asn)/Glu-tRNA(Gln) amidotransferase subunit GatA [Anaerolineae bacterium]